MQTSKQTNKQTNEHTLSYIPFHPIPFIRALLHSFFGSVVSVIQSFTHSCTHPFVHAFINSFFFHLIHPAMHAFHSFSFSFQLISFQIMSCHVSRSCHSFIHPFIHVIPFLSLVPLRAFLHPFKHPSIQPFTSLRCISFHSLHSFINFIH